MSRNISIEVKEDNFNFKIRLADYCWNCVDDRNQKIIKEKCDQCDNKRIQLTDNGKVIIGLAQHFLNLDKIDLEDCTESDSDRGYGYRR